MNICHVLWGLSYGGIETMVVNIANLQANADHNLSIMIINDIIDETLLKKLDPRIKTLFIKRPIGSKNPYYILKANVALLKEKPDLVHFHQLDQKRFFIRSISEKHCVTIHSDWLPYMRKFINSYKNIFVISKYVKENIEKNSHSQTNLIYNGIRVDNFKQKTKWFEKGKKPFKILQLGRIVFSFKGQDVFVEALNILNSKKIDFEADIIGIGKDSQRLQELIEERGLSDKIKLLGLKEQDYLKEHLCDYDLVVHPSRHEGFGLVIIEAMAAKVPVLISDIKTQVEIIDNGKAGYIFKSEDASSMAKEIVNIMNNYNIDITERAYQYVTKNFKVEMTTQRYLEEYNKIVNS